MVKVVFFIIKTLFIGYCVLVAVLAIFNRVYSYYDLNEALEATNKIVLDNEDVSTAMDVFKFIMKDISNITSPKNNKSLLDQSIRDKYRLNFTNLLYFHELIRKNVIPQSGLDPGVNEAIEQILAVYYKLDGVVNSYTEYYLNTYDMFLRAKDELLGWLKNISEKEKDGDINTEGCDFQGMQTNSDACMPYIQQAKVIFLYNFLMYGYALTGDEMYSDMCWEFTTPYVRFQPLTESTLSFTDHMIEKCSNL